MDMETLMLEGWKQVKKFKKIPKGTGSIVLGQGEDKRHKWVTRLCFDELVNKGAYVRVSRWERVKTGWETYPSAVYEKYLKPGEPNGNGTVGRLHKRSWTGSGAKKISLSKVGKRRKNVTGRS